MRKNLVNIAASSLLVLSLAGCNAISSKPERVEWREIAQNPKGYEGKHVAVDGRWICSRDERKGYYRFVLSGLTGSFYSPIQKDSLECEIYSSEPKIISFKSSIYSSGQELLVEGRVNKGIVKVKKIKSRTQNSYKYTEYNF